MKTVLHISTAGVQFWHQSAHSWQPCDSLPAGALWVVCNLPEESFAEIQIPRIFGNDRLNFIRRQLASRFPDSPYSTVLAQPGSGSFMERLAPPRQTLFGVDAAQPINEALDKLMDAPVAGVWATSMLMVQMCAHKSLPKELFVVLPGVEGLRIVFVKNHMAVLSRLVPGVTHAADQTAEITRTVRHLENSRVLTRSSEPRNVLLLDNQPDQESWLTQERLKRIPVPPPWGKTPPADWRFALFDLAVTSPAGQLAPVSRRTPFIANQLRPWIYTTAGLFVGLAVWAAAGNLNDIARVYTNGKQVQKQLDQLTAQTSDIEIKIAKFGVSAEMVRSAVVLEQDEIASAPSLLAHMQQLSGVVSAFDPVRISQLDWRIVAAGQSACNDKAIAAPSNTPVLPTAAQAQKRKVEISFEIAWPSEQGEKVRTQGITSLSAKLAKIEGASLMLDPAQELKLGPLQGGSAGAGKPADHTLNWCLALPGTRTASAERQP